MRKLENPDRIWPTDKVTFQQYHIHIEKFITWRQIQHFGRVTLAVFQLTLDCMEHIYYFVTQDATRFCDVNTLSAQ